MTMSDKGRAKLVKESGKKKKGNIGKII